MGPTRWWSAVAVVSLGAVAVTGCGDDSAGAGGAPADPTEFAAEVAAVIDEMHAGFAAATDDYFAELTDGPDLIDVEQDWFVRSASLLGDAGRALPGAPGDPLGEPYEAMTAALESWATEAEGAVVALDENRQAFVAGWETGERERFEAVLAPVRVARGGFEDACLDLAEVLVAESNVAVDCLGRRAIATDAPGVEAAIGGVDLAVAEGSGVVLEQVTDRVVSVVDPSLRLDIVGDPIFVDPSGPIDPLDLGAGVGWPDEMEAWFDAVGAEVVGTGALRVGDFGATHWDVRTSLDKIAAIAGGDSIPIAASQSLGPAALVHLDPVIVVRLIRIDIDPETAFLATTFGADPDLGPELSSPTDLTPAPEVFAWLDETVLPALTMR